jgi:hypothetical protein
VGGAAPTAGKTYAVVIVGIRGKGGRSRGAMTIGGAAKTGLGSGGSITGPGTKGGREGTDASAGIAWAIFFSVVGFFLSKRANIYILYQEYK